MNTPALIQKLEHQIDRIKQELAAVGEMRPGSLTQQYNVCGNPRCRCKDPQHPRRHGPYYQLSYVHRGRNTTEFIRRPRVPVIKKQLAQFKRFRRLTKQWVDLALRLAKLKLKLMTE